MKARVFRHVAVVAVLSLSGAAVAMPPPMPVTIRNPWIVNDRVADCRSITTMGATFKNSYTPDGVVAPADDQATAINCYNNHKRRYYHWADVPPDGPNGIPLNDPVYGLNIFGWGLCFNHGPQNATIVKAAGLDGRRIDLITPSGTSQHTIYEAYYWGKWHLLDTMTTMYVYDRGSPRQIASCADIAADGTLMTAAAGEGRACPGFLLCGDSASWFAGAILNHWEATPGGIITDNWSMNMDLHTGETLKRGWDAWQNQHPTAKTNADGNNVVGPDEPYHHECQNDWKDPVNYPYWEPYGQVIPYIHTSKKTYRRWANGTYEMRPDFRTQTYQAMVYSSSGVATYADDGLTPDLHPAAVGATGEMVFKIALPFYHTDANISGSFVRTNTGDVTQLQVSTNGTTWTTVWTGTQLGTTTLNGLNLRSQVFGTWGYYLKVVLMSASGSKASAGVSNLVISTVFEHNKGATAYLDKGVNHITVTFDNPQDLAGNYTTLKVTYKWKEYNGSAWAVDRSYVKYLTTSPATFTITTGGTKVPRTEFVQMDVISKYPGDIDEDGHVDVIDLLTFVETFGKTEADAGYDPRCDLDVDDVVDVIDLLCLIPDWGQ